MSINDPQWGNSHRPEQKEPDQAPENAGAAPAQPESAAPDGASPLTGADTTQETPKETRPALSGGQQPSGGPSSTKPEGPPDLEELWQQLVYRARCRIAAILRRPAPPAPQPMAQSLSRPGVSTQARGTAESTDAAPFNWQALSWQSWLIGGFDFWRLVGEWFLSGRCQSAGFGQSFRYRIRHH